MSARTPSTRRRLQPWVHEPVDDRPYYDAELDVSQSHAHDIMVVDLVSILRGLAEEADLEVFSDHSIWYFDAENDRQRVVFADLLLARAGTDERRLTVDQGLFVAEVVSTHDRRKEVKDTRVQLALNEYNEVPEFALFFPELDDPRSIYFYRMVDGRYEELKLSPGARFEVSLVPGLAFRVKPKSAWAKGDKFEVLYQGELRLPVAGERARAAAERARADEAETRARQLQAEIAALRAKRD